MNIKVRCQSGTARFWCYDNEIKYEDGHNSSTQVILKHEFKGVCSVGIGLDGHESTKAELFPRLTSVSIPYIAMNTVDGQDVIVSAWTNSKNESLHIYFSH